MYLNATQSAVWQSAAVLCAACYFTENLLSVANFLSFHLLYFNTLWLIKLLYIT